MARTHWILVAVFAFVAGFAATGAAAAPAVQRATAATASAIVGPAASVQGHQHHGHHDHDGHHHHHEEPDGCEHDCVNCCVGHVVPVAVVAPTTLSRTTAPVAVVAALGAGVPDSPSIDGPFQVPRA